MAVKTLDTASAAGVPRQRTAIRRYRCSRPVSVALADGIITKDTVVLDYGCGLGGDIRYLQKQRITAAGWDPHHRPDGTLGPADVVHLGYVLNVIEDPQERMMTLRRAYEFARRALIVAVRVDRTLDDADEFGDGYLTNRGTFQKIYTQAEFREYLEQTVGRRSHAAGLGMAYVFADDQAEASYLANRAFTRRLEYRTDLIAEFKKSRVAQRFVALANTLGRVPLPEEFRGYDRLVETFGSSERINRLTLHHIDSVSFDGSRAQRRDDILVFLAMLRLQGLKPPPISALPPTVRSDIKTIWPTYAAAQTEGTEFLFRLGDPQQVKQSAAGLPVGKLVADDLYIHRSIEDDLPALLRLIVFAAKQIVGDVIYNIIKVRTDGRAISFLYYPDFDHDAHPALQSSIRVYLPKATYDIRDYATSDNPPILHRKDAFVSTTHPLFQQFHGLTAAEERAGLLDAPNIGYRQAWRIVLSERGYSIRGHDLVKP